VKEYLEANYLNPELHLPTAADGARVWDVDWFDLARPPLEPSAPILAPAWEPPFRRARPPSQPASESQVWDPESVQLEMSEIFDSGTGEMPSPMPGSAKDFVRGSMNSRPFRPGGLQDAAAEAAALEKAFPEGARNGDWVRELMGSGPAQVAPPGFRKGLEFGQLKVCSLLNLCLFCYLRIVVDVLSWCLVLTCRSIKATGSVSGMENL
jgi:antiviral helicase SKI2